MTHIRHVDIIRQCTLKIVPKERQLEGIAKAKAAGVCAGKEAAQGCCR
jgi:hypothetical protein